MSSNDELVRSDREPLEIVGEVVQNLVVAGSGSPRVVASHRPTI